MSASEPEALEVEVLDPSDAAAALMPRRQLAESAEMDITPMINITFLLLIFFLVSSRMENQASVDLPEARHGTTVASRESVLLTVACGEGDRARIFRGGQIDDARVIAGATLEDEQEEIVAYVRAELGGSPPKQHVIIRAEPAVLQREIARIERAVALADEGVRLYVAVLEVP